MRDRSSEGWRNATARQSLGAGDCTVVWHVIAAGSRESFYEAA